jgi:phospholipase C
MRRPRCTVAPLAILTTAGLVLGLTGCGVGTAISRSITVPPPPLSLSTTSLPSGITHSAYAGATLQATGGVQPYTWAVITGTLPSGLALDGKTGAISGMATSAGVSSFTVSVTDSESPTAKTAAAKFSITIVSPQLSVATTSLPSGLTHIIYTGATLQATGGVQPYTWTVITGTLPSGLALDGTTGSISGTATTAGLSDFIVAVTDSETPTAKTATANLSITINANSTIQHVVVIFQENRTPDNLFQDPVLISRGADIVQSGVNSKGQTIPLSPIDLGNPYDVSHTHAAFVKMCDLNAATGQCRMDGAPTTPNSAFMYVKPSDVQPYFQMAEQYTFGDRMFQTNQGPSFPAHQYIISGTSAPAVGSTSFAAENPNGGSGGRTGCIAAATEFVWLIDPFGKESSTMYPCFEHPTLTDALDTKGVSWRYYTPGPDSIWTAPNAIEHMCGPNAPPPNGTACVGSIWVNNVVLKETKVLTDINNNALPQVSWVVPSGLNSDHSGDAHATGGPSWVASIVNAIGNSPYWADTAIFITWDDWGGWYDHVPPKLLNSYEYGFRVPLIVVSPYAKPGYISHVTHDFGSILKFIEETYGLPSLGYADAAADDLSDCFDLNQSPIAFKTINAPLNAAYFLNYDGPRTDPDDD